MIDGPPGHVHMALPQNERMFISNRRMDEPVVIVPGRLDETR
jgi:hypothetical protein